MSFIDKLNNFREVEHSVAHRKMLQEKICWFHADQLGSNNEGNIVQTHSLVSLVPQIKPEENEKKKPLGVWNSGSLLGKPLIIRTHLIPMSSKKR